MSEFKLDKFFIILVLLVKYQLDFELHSAKEPSYTPNLPSLKAAEKANALMHAVIAPPQVNIFFPSPGFTPAAVKISFI